MTTRAQVSMVDGVAVHYHEFGVGMPVLILHGVGVDHREMVAALEPLFTEAAGYRRIYPDLPGMGETPAPDSLSSNDDVLGLVVGFVNGVIGNEQFVVVGHSYGGYLGRAIAQRCGSRVAGLALICPATDHAREVPGHVVLDASIDLAGRMDPAQADTFRSYFVVQTPETLRRFREAVAPAGELVDSAALERIFERWPLRDAGDEGQPFTRPVLILAGRQDSSVGYADAWRLIERYPRSTFAVLDRAGHALPHEQGPLVVALMAEWLKRVQESRHAA